MLGDLRKAQEVFHTTLREAGVRVAQGEVPREPFWLFRDARWRCLEARKTELQPESFEMDEQDIAPKAASQIEQSRSSATGDLDFRGAGSAAERTGTFLSRRIRLPRNSRHSRTQVEHAVAIPVRKGRRQLQAWLDAKHSWSSQGMRTLRLLRRRRALLNCAPISHDHSADRSMRAAVSREDGSDEFVNQQNFDRAVAELIRLVPIPPESAEWFLEKEAVRRSEVDLEKDRAQSCRPRDQHRSRGHRRGFRVQCAQSTK